MHGAIYQKPYLPYILIITFISMHKNYFNNNQLDYFAATLPTGHPQLMPGLLLQAQDPSFKFGFQRHAKLVNNIQICHKNYILCEK